MAALGAALVSSGCFRYVPVAPGAVPPGADVRVYVSRRAMADVPEELASGGAYLTGRLARATADSVLLQLPVTRADAATGTLDLRQNVFLPASEIVEVRLRELSRSRTFFAVGGAAGLGLAIVAVVIDARGNSVDDPGEGPDQIRIPLFSISAP